MPLPPGFNPLGMEKPLPPVFNPMGMEIPLPEAFNPGGMGMPMIIIRRKNLKRNTGSPVINPLNIFSGK